MNSQFVYIKNFFYFLSYQQVFVYFACNA